jgi:hypothetical protein
MNSASSNPFYGASSARGAQTAASGHQRQALDNLLRRELRVSDPNDPQQIANALLERFKEDPRARGISQEARGLPFLQALPVSAPVAQAATSSDSELQQAKNDVERDLEELLTNSLLKDVTPEIQGWAQGVRAAIREGTMAARFSLDARQRDKAFAIRRQLGDYARVARLVGALTPTLNQTYRKFAQSLDEVAAVILVSMGEALSNVGFNGRFLLQAPYSELQVRRDSAIYALRNLVGATQEAYSSNEWPRGLDAYRRLYDVLEKQGQGDLRSLLVEHELARTMDELIQRAAHGRVEGLRALGSTAQLDLERFRRMVIVGQRVVNPESPPLTAFLEALQLFADAFEGSGGFRLVRIARPPILFYGLYGTNIDDADKRLLDLIILRGQLADELDCFLQCGCSPENVRCQIVLDKILYDLDRAIDLYALGTEDFGAPERRAAAFSFVIEAFRESRLVNQSQPGQPPTPNTCQIRGPLATLLTATQDKLRPSLVVSGSGADPDLADMLDELVVYADGIRDQLTTAGLCGVTPNVCLGINNIIGAGSPFTIPANLSQMTELFRLAKIGENRLLQADEKNVPTSTESVDAFFAVFQQELCIQEDMEEHWRNLVKSFAPNCFGVDAVLNSVEQVVTKAIGLVSGTSCPIFQPSIPPHYETLLDQIANNIDTLGTRP